MLLMLLVPLVLRMNLPARWSVLQPAR